MQLSMTLTPNRSTPRQYARMMSYRRNGKRVDRVFIQFNRWGKVDRTKQAPMAEESKDWTREQAGPRQRAYALADRAIVPMMTGAPDVVMDAYMATPKNQPLTTFTELEERTVQVAPIAKRDWLIAMGAIRPHEWKPETDAGQFGAAIVWEGGKCSVLRHAAPASVSESWAY